MEGALNKIKKSIENAETNDKTIVNFLNEIMEKEKEGLYGFRNTYRTKITEYSKKWEEKDEI